MTEATRGIKRKLMVFLALRGVRRRFFDLPPFRQCPAVLLHLEEAVSAIRNGHCVSNLLSETGKTLQFEIRS